MSTIIEVTVPDIGDFSNIPVIEVLVKPGDSISREDTLVTLESDKATMDVPSPASGVVRDLKIKVGDKVSEGSLLLTLDSEEQAAKAAAPEAKSAPAPAPAVQESRTRLEAAPAAQAPAHTAPATPGSSIKADIHAEYIEKIIPA